MYVRLYVRSSVCNMYEVLLTYCHSACFVQDIYAINNVMIKNIINID